MSENKEFDWGVCKVPRNGKRGEDITNDVLQGGGRHRKNGTFSGQAFDIELVDNDPRKENEELRKENKDLKSKREEDKSKISTYKHEKTIYEIIGLIAIGKLLFDKIREKYNEYKRDIERIDEIVEIRRREQKDEEHCNNELLKDECKKHTVNMTKDEAKRKIIETRILQYLFLKNMDDLNNAIILDDEGNIIQGKEIVKYLEDSKNIERIECYINGHYDLISESYGNELKKFLALELGKGQICNLN